jgi:hypothetical protein
VKSSSNGSHSLKEAYLTQASLKKACDRMSAVAKRIEANNRGWKRVLCHCIARCVLLCFTIACNDAVLPLSQTPTSEAVS